MIIFVFGLIDDIHTLRAIIKLLIQIVATCLVIFSGNRFKQIGPFELPLIISYVLTFCWIIGVINAFNLIDGLDGLCGSLSFTTILTLGIIYTLSSNNVAVICFILAASILGFLCFNWPPAKLFMGDCGSQFLGFMIATLPLIPSDNVIEFNKFLIIVSLAAFPIFDTIAAIVAALVIIPACFAYNLDVGSGPSLLFVTLPRILQDIPLNLLSKQPKEFVLQVLLTIINLWRV